MAFDPAATMPMGMPALDPDAQEGAPAGGSPLAESRPAVRRGGTGAPAPLPPPPPPPPHWAEPADGQPQPGPAGRDPGDVPAYPAPAGAPGPRAADRPAPFGRPGDDDRPARPPTPQRAPFGRVDPPAADRAAHDGDVYDLPSDGLGAGGPLPGADRARTAFDGLSGADRPPFGGPGDDRRPGTSERPSFGGAGDEGVGAPGRVTFGGPGDDRRPGASERAPFGRGTGGEDAGDDRRGRSAFDGLSGAERPPFGGRAEAEGRTGAADGSPYDDRTGGPRPGRDWRADEAPAAGRDPRHVLGDQPAGPAGPTERERPAARAWGDDRGAARPGPDEGPGSGRDPRHVAGDQPASFGMGGPEPRERSHRRPPSRSSYGRDRLAPGSDGPTPGRFEPGWPQGGRSAADAPSGDRWAPVDRAGTTPAHEGPGEHEAGGGRVERPGRSDRPGDLGAAARGDRPDAGERTGRPDGPGRRGTADAAGRGDRADRPDEDAAARSGAHAGTQDSSDDWGKEALGQVDSIQMGRGPLDRAAIEEAAAAWGASPAGVLPGADWRTSIPREFVARTPMRPASPSGEPANGRSLAGAYAPVGGPAPGADRYGAAGQATPGERAHADDEARSARPPDARPEPGRTNGVAGANGVNGAGVNGANGHGAPGLAGPGAGGPGPTGPGRPPHDREAHEPGDHGRLLELGEGSLAGPPRPGDRPGGQVPAPAGRATGAIHAADSAGPWNELDREIARAVAATLAGKLSRYVNPNLLPLVAEELGRTIGPRDDSGG